MFCSLSFWFAKNVKAVRLHTDTTTELPFYSKGSVITLLSAFEYLPPFDWLISHGLIKTLKNQ